MSLELIGISGKKQSGKDAVCTFLKQCNYPKPFQRIAFADALKEEVARACSCSVDYLETNKQHFRLILQGWGSDFRRDLCKRDYWIEKWAQKILKIQEEDMLIVVPDVRFKNEYVALKEVGGLMLRVVRPENGTALDLHPSETELDNEEFDYVILNDGNLEQLREKVKNVYTNRSQNTSR